MKLYKREIEARSSGSTGEEKERGVEKKGDRDYEGSLVNRVIN